MNLLSLAQNNLFIYMLILCRVGTPLMFLPGIGDTFVMPRIRLIFALMLSFVLLPVLYSQLPSMPNSNISIVFILLEELMIGAILGLVIKLIMSALHVTGMTIAFTSGLSSGMLFDPSQGSQGSLFGNILTIIATILIISTNLHHIFIMGIVESYNSFPIGSLATHYDSYFDMIFRIGADAFNTGIKLSAPFMVVAIVFYLASGILSRLMPQLQIFFIMLPAQIFVSLVIFLLTISAIMLWFLDHYNDVIYQLFTI